MSGTPDPLAEFERHRAYLFGIAYRMLGSVAEAEDMVQDCWLRWSAADRIGVAKPRSFLARTVTRLCIDHQKSARVRRETYVGPWLPEPLADGLGPGIEMERAETVTMALMLALERLSPLERAAYLLRDIFDMDFPEIASALGRSEASCRQLASRARRHIREAKPRFPVAGADSEKLVDAFIAASQEGDIGTLASLLAQDVAVHTDGGGKRIAALNVIRGREKVVRFIAGLHRKLGAWPPGIVWRGTMNGLPAILSRDADGVLQSDMFAVADGRIEAIYTIRNPAKLAHIEPYLTG
ncbi:MAG: sigma-70 family RNA polymerase sigma factor [Pseudomonadota bacterium]